MSNPEHSIEITHINYKGTRKRTEGDEYAELTNRGSSTVDISGFKLMSHGSRGQVFVFPAKTTLQPGTSIRVYTDKHEPETGGFSFGSKAAIWNNRGDEGTLFDRSGQVVSQYAYGNRRPRPAGPAAPDSTAEAARALSPAMVWDKVRALWPGFEFMWRPGDSEAQIAAAEVRLGVKLPQRVRELLQVCSGAGFPSRFSPSHAAEVCLFSVADWRPLTEALAEQDLEHEPETAGCLLIGEDPQGVDYGIYVLLRPETGEVLCLRMNEGLVESCGSFDRWLLARRPGDDPGNPSRIYSSALEEEFGVDEEDAGAEAIARTHRKYLGYSQSGKLLLVRWNQIEPQFIAAVERLRGATATMT